MFKNNFSNRNIVLLDLNQTWYRYFLGYAESVELMYKAIAEDDNLGTLAYPFLFLVRHTLEVGFKANIYALSKYSEENYGLDDQNNIKSGHILPPLQDALIKHFEVLSKYEGKSSSTYKEFHNLSNKLKVLVKYFDKIDNRSYVFRYPVDKNGHPSSDASMQIDLDELKSKYDETIILLRDTPNVLSGLFTMIDEHRSSVIDSFREY